MELLHGNRQNYCFHDFASLNFIFAFHSKTVIPLFHDFLTLAFVSSAKICLLGSLVYFII